MKRDRRSGIALILAALFLLILVPMLGLAVDGANSYLRRIQISTALNAAVLAANRSLSVGADIASQEANAMCIGTAVFEADTGSIAGMTMQMVTNNCSGSSSSVQPQIAWSFTESASHYVTVTATASAQVPLYFMGILKQPNISFTISASATRRNVNIILVLDHGYPMGALTSSGTPMAEMQTDATAFVNMFANNRDTMGLVTFTTVPYDAVRACTVPAASGGCTTPNQNFQANVTAAIASLQASGTNKGVPNTAAALSAAYAQLQALDQPGALNVVVLFTDQIPSAFTGNFTLNAKGQTGLGCSTAGPITGVILSQSSQQYSSGALSWGLTQYTETVGENDAPEGNPATGCANAGPIRSTYLPSLPTTDYYSNATSGSYPPVPVNSNNASAQNVIAAAEYAADAAATTIRTDNNNPSLNNLQPVIFTIGLNGNLDVAPDPVLMAKIANDSSSLTSLGYGSYYQSSQPTGKSIIAPTTAQLQSAFASIAAQVLRLAQAQ